MADFRIVSGIPQYTRDGGATWEELPVSADLLQNEWQDSEDGAAELHHHR